MYLLTTDRDPDVLLLGHNVSDAVDNVLGVLSAAAFFNVHNTYYRQSNPKCQPFFCGVFTTMLRRKNAAMHKLMYSNAELLGQ